MTDGPSVSCIMAVWNGERHLRDAIESVLSQSEPPVEFIVVNDGSTDATESILASFGPAVRVLQQERSGQASALNTGIRASTSDLITFLDSDDILDPDAIAVRLPILAESESTDAVFGTCEQFISPEVPAERAQKLRFEARPEEALLAMTMVARRTVFERYGHFDETRVAGAFIDWFARARSQGLSYETLDVVVARRRLHGTNMSLTTGRAGNRDLLAIVRDHHRRRGDKRP